MTRTTALLALSAALTACGGGSGNPDTDPFLPSGEPAGSSDDLVLMPMSTAAYVPADEWPSENGLDSTWREWRELRDLPSPNDNACHHLMGGMIASRGSPEEATADRVSPMTWWYWNQGYTVTFGYDGEECEAEDYRFEPGDDRFKTKFSEDMFWELLPIDEDYRFRPQFD